MVEQPLGLPVTAPARGGPGVGRTPRDKCPSALVPGVVQQRCGGATVLSDRRREPAVERGGDRELIPDVDLERVRECARAVRRAGMVAQKLVDGRQFAADPSRVPAAGVGGPLGLPDLAAGVLQTRLAVTPGRERALNDPGLLGDGGLGARELGLQRDELPGELRLPVLTQRLQLTRHRRDPRLRLGIRGVTGGLRGERLDRLPGACHPRADGHPRGLQRFGAVADPLTGAARRVGAARELLAVGTAG